MARLFSHGDDQFFDAVKWVVFALIEAEEKGHHLGRTSRVPWTLRGDPTIQRLLGISPGMGEAPRPGRGMGEAGDRIRRQTTGEIFERNVGPENPDPGWTAASMRCGPKAA